MLKSFYVSMLYVDSLSLSAMAQFLGGFPDDLKNKLLDGFTVKSYKEHDSDEKKLYEFFQNLGSQQG